MADNQNVTLSLPRVFWKRVTRVTADRDTSVSSLMIEVLTETAGARRRDGEPSQR